ncbi:biotin transporter BioY [Metabacillus idriensis]|uniref:Biotin transporter n=1 Tax=Metabacillus idriensis TaxID=324768 RepID=A0A6I2MDZ1_9BACI|nr:biotin transporter BioY [Metabacillus idriensis]MCM3597721.1 biotin transporter BioY [Metabacillus idriensis]MRX54631.1 BioY family transporter [Metabacillus idriensis]OHR68924.1 BioY family transporter [Bacillus sp. HMSC76G11]
MKNKLKAYDLALVGMFAALMAIGANLTSFLTVGTVPLSMQPFFCILAGLLLGSRLGALSMIVYALVGIAGAPVFAQFSGGIGVIFGSTGGFILSYIAAAYAAGIIVEASKKPTLPVFFLSSFAGIALIYIIGTTYMYAALNYWLNADMSYSAAWLVMTWFMVKDLIFTAIGAVIAPRIYKAVNRATGLGKHRAA